MCKRFDFNFTGILNFFFSVNSKCFPGPFNCIDMSPWPVLNVLPTNRVVKDRPMIKQDGGKQVGDPDLMPVTLLNRRQIMPTITILLLYDSDSFTPVRAVHDEPGSAAGTSNPPWSEQRHFPAVARSSHPARTIIILQR